jgi:hypothetical protein
MKLLKLLKPVLVLAICLLAMAQCGLEYLPFLTAPVSIGPSVDIFSVRKTAANDTESAIEWEYQGIELYYKFYLPTETPDNNLTELIELNAKGFRRISSSGDQATSVQKPLIDGKAFLGDVDFDIDMENTDITETSTPVVVVSEIRRGVPYDSDEIGYYPYFQRFLFDDFDAADADVGTSIYGYITSIPFSEIKMAVYALSYGKKDYVVDLYSEAVYLGEIQVNFGW